MKQHPILLAAAACVLFLGQSGAGCIYTLSSGNASAVFDLDSQAGLQNLSVNGQEQVDQQGFWYRIGNSGGEQSFDSIANLSVIQPTQDTLQATYANKEISIQVLYSLAGADSAGGDAAISEQVEISNLTRRAQDVHLFQYSDLDLSGITQLTRNLDGLFDGACVTGAAGSVIESVDGEFSPGANHGVAGVDTLCQLEDGKPTTLANHPGPSTNATWTLEWDNRLSGKGTLTLIQNLKFVPVPEPSVVLLLLAGTGSCALRKRS